MLKHQNYNVYNHRRKVQVVFMPPKIKTRKKLFKFLSNQMMLNDTSLILKRKTIQIN